LPNVPEDYVHRIGRTGRAGATGAAVSLVDNSEVKLLKAIERLIGKTIPRLPVEGWTPDASSNAASFARQEREDDSRQPRRQGAPRSSASKGGAGRSSGNGEFRAARSPGGDGEHRAAPRTSQAPRPGQAPRTGSGRAPAAGHGANRAAAPRSDRPAGSGQGARGSDARPTSRPSANRPATASRGALLGK
jgi:ATP-dependent RNA helicase RhlE